MQDLKTLTCLSLLSLALLFGCHTPPATDFSRGFDQQVHPLDPDWLEHSPGIETTGLLSATLTNGSTAALYQVVFNCGVHPKGPFVQETGLDFPSMGIYVVHLRHAQVSLPSTAPLPSGESPPGMDAMQETAYWGFGIL